MHLNGLFLIPFFFLTRLNIIFNKSDGAKNSTKKQYKRLSGWSLDIAKPQHKNSLFGYDCFNFGT